MAELHHPTTKPPTKRAPELGIPLPPPPTTTHQQKPSSFLTSFICKAFFFAIFATLLPLFPSQAPEFVNQTLLTRSWELLHLLLVGIAVSYGLFSHRNPDPAAEKEAAALYKSDSSPQSYVSEFLQVSSVFDDDEAGIPSASDGNKVQMWNSQYCRGEPAVGVAPQTAENGGDAVSSPLFLPVRNLKSRPPHPEPNDSRKGVNGCPGPSVGSRSFPKGRSEIGGVTEIGGFGTSPVAEELADSVVLPSPIPWRSRSGRMEVKEESGMTTPPSYSLPAASVGTDIGAFKSPSFRSPPSRSSSTTSSPRKLSPSPSLSPELRAKTGEDLGKRRSSYKPPPPAPPPPPPPPPPFGHRSSYLSDKKDVKSFKDELKDFSRTAVGEDWVSGDDLGYENSKFDMKSRSHVEGSPTTGRSVRTIRSKEVGGQGAIADRTKKVGSEQPPEKPIRDVPPMPSTPTFQDQIENMKVTMLSDDSDSDDCSECSEVVDLPNSAAEVEPDENEVDKKADEFIAKFREQIRLQRIESIKRSSGQHGLRNPK